MQMMKAPITYLALGDSITEGVGADHQDRNLVSQIFCSLQQTTHCRMQNMGISGLTSGELYALLQTPGFRKLIPRVTHFTITTGGCDFIDWYEAGASITNVIQTMRRIRLQTENIIALIRQGNPHASVQLMGFYVPAPAYELGFPIASRALQSMNIRFAQLAKKFSIHFVNPFDAFLHRQDFFADEVHPNQRGYDALAQLFMPPKQAKELPVKSQYPSTPEGSLC